MEELKTSPTSVPPALGWFGRLKRRFPILAKKRGKAILVAILCLPLLALLGLLALRNGGGGPGGGDAGASTTEVIMDDTAFYGDSEPVYPSRESRTPVYCAYDKYNMG